MDETHPLIIVTHFNHPRELAEANTQALALLVNAGVGVRNQSVLLRKVNDSVETVRTLFKALTNRRVVPYYLHQLDLARGTSHFRVPIHEGIEIMRELQGTTTGIALPRYMLDIPNGKGKIPLQYSFLTEQTDGSYLAENFFREKITYVEPK